jgi:hypothetical protein
LSVDIGCWLIVGGRLILVLVVGRSIDGSVVGLLIFVGIGWSILVFGCSLSVNIGCWLIVVCIYCKWNKRNYIYVFVLLLR